MKKLLFKVIQLVTFNYYFKARKKNTLLILMFHRVNDNHSTFYCPMPVKAFKELCEFVKARYEVINIIAKSPAFLQWQTSNLILFIK